MKPLHNHSEEQNMICKHVFSESDSPKIICRNPAGDLLCQICQTGVTGGGSPEGHEIELMSVCNICADQIIESRKENGVEVVDVPFTFNA